jgi:hypothetical protein
MVKLKTVAEVNGTAAGKRGQPQLTPDLYRDLIRIIELAAELAPAVAGRPTVDRNTQLALEVVDAITALERRHKVKIKR